jgi:hypothetical protein
MSHGAEADYRKPEALDIVHPILSRVVLQRSSEKATDHDESCETWRQAHSLEDGRMNQYLSRNSTCSARLA